MTIKLFFTGDIVVTKDYSGALFDTQLQDLVKQYDIVCGNFEAPIVQVNSQKSNKIGPTINQNPSIVARLKESGFNLLTLANNHIMDYGKEGLQYTLNKLSGVNLIGAGNSLDTIYKPFKFQKEGVTIGIVSVAENGFGCVNDENGSGYAWIYSINNIQNIVRLKEEVDVLIMIVHAGAEMTHFPLPEWRQAYKTFINLGVDIIIGHHPHVVQGYEEYKEGIIFYSLGNLAFDSNTKNGDWFSSYGVEIEVTNKQNYEYKIIPLLYNEGKVQIDSEEALSKLEEYCDVLKKEEMYLKHIDDFCDKVFEESYKDYYSNILNLSKEAGLKSKFKNSIKCLMGKTSNINYSWLYHNIQIESHRYICARKSKNSNERNIK